MCFGRLMCFWQSLRPHFLCRYCDSECSRKPPNAHSLGRYAPFKKKKMKRQNLSIKNEISEILDDFIEVCKYSRINLTKDEIIVEILESGDKHSPKPLHKGFMAVYIFWDFEKNICYKVGKVGVNSNARFQSQHYNPNSSKSNLATSILNDYELNHSLEIQNNVGLWIKQNTTRINLYLKGENSMLTLSLLEIFIQNRLKPKYEGYESQL